MRFESSIFDCHEGVCIGFFDRVFSSAYYWFDKYVIIVKIKENKEVIVAAEGWYEKLTCLISAYFSSDVLKINVSTMSIKTCSFFV